MLNKERLLSLILFLGISLGTFSQMIIMTGPEKGSYHRFGEDIMKALEMDSIYSFRALPSKGAANNFEQLVDPNTPVKIAFIQSDYLYYRQKLDNKNNTNKTAPLSVLMPLANEEIHVIIRNEGRIKSLQDLAKKNVACGNENTGTYATAILMKDRSRVFWNTKLMRSDQALKDLMGRKLDAFIMVGAAPLQLLDINPQSMVEGITIIPLANVNDWAKYYTPALISASDYKWLDNDVNTFSVRTLMVVNESKLTEEDKIKLEALSQSLRIHHTDLMDFGHPKWQEVNFANWSADDWRIYKR